MSAHEMNRNYNTFKMVEDATSLLCKALKPKLRPERDEDYRRLVALYQHSSQFRETFDAVCAGADCELLNVDDFGVVVTPLEGSLFSIRFSDYRTSLTEDKKQAMLVLHLCIAYAFYPDPAELQIISTQVAKTDFDTIFRVFKSFIHQAEQDYKGNDPEKLPLWRSVTAIQDYYAKPNRDGKTQGINSVKGLFKCVLNQLTEQGQLRLVDKDSRGGIYKALMPYRVQLREWSLSQSYQTINNQFKLS